MRGGTMRGRTLHWKMIKGPQIGFTIVENTAIDDGWDYLENKPAI